ncbi:MAG: DUF3127 domain-containing protein [Marinilabiliaceae bacterium]
MSFELQGKLIVKEDTVQVSDKFKKREFVIEVPNDRRPEWPDLIKFQATQDKVDILEPYNIGDELKVHFNIRGKKWEKNGRVNYFTNLDAWRVDKVGSGDDAGAGGPVNPPMPDHLDDLPPESDEGDGFPF